MKLTNLPRHVVLIALVSCATLMLSGAAFAGAWWWVNTMEQTLYETKASAKRAEEERKQFSSLEKLAAETAADRERLEGYVVTEQGVIGFLSELEGVVRASGASPETHSIGTAPLANDQYFEELTVTMGVSGEARAVSEALRAIERMPYQLRIENASMRGALSTTRADVVIIATKMKAY